MKSYVLAGSSAFGLLLLTACATVTVMQAPVKVAEPEEVLHCQMIGRVVAKSSVPFLHSGVRSAKAKAMDEAAKSGATHLVWETIESSWSTQASAKVYACD